MNIMTEEEFMKLAVSEGYELKLIKNYCKHKKDGYTYTDDDFVRLHSIKSTSDIIRRLIMNDCIKTRKGK